MESFEEIRERYRRQGLAARVGFGERPAILVVDFYRGSIEADSPLSCDLENPVRQTVRILEAARQGNVPVYFTVVEYENEKDGGYFWKKVPSLKVLMKGSKWVELDPRMGRRADEMIVKKHYASAFFGTQLVESLRKQHVDTVVVTGCTTSGCVRASVVDALQNGFRPIVAEGAVGDRSELVHEANLFDMDAKYADVESVDMVIKHLREAGSPLRSASFK